MIDCLVFSKDRAAQLDLLLRSIRRHAPNLYQSLTVLYTGSSADYLRGYQQCFAEHEEAKFILEHDFEAQTRKWLDLAGPAVSFLVDDDVFYRDAPDLTPPDRYRFDGAVSLRGGDYWYPFSVDGNVYRRDHIVTLLDGLRFRDPTELEAKGHDVRARLPFNAVSAIVRPCLVGVPANRVSLSSGMPHMGVDPRGLNEMYLDGWYLDVKIPEHLQNKMGAHEALDYSYTIETTSSVTV